MDAALSVSPLSPLTPILLALVCLRCCVQSLATLTADVLAVRTDTNTCTEQIHVLDTRIVVLEDELRTQHTQHKEIVYVGLCLRCLLLGHDVDLFLCLFHVCVLHV